MEAEFGGQAINASSRLLACRRPPAANPPRTFDPIMQISLLVKLKLTNYATIQGVPEIGVALADRLHGCHGIYLSNGFSVTDLLFQATGLSAPHIGVGRVRSNPPL
jgi:hypothetical protein